MNNKEKIVLAVVAVLVVAGVALGATGVISFKKQSPEIVFAKMATAKGSVTSAHVDTKVVADIGGKAPGQAVHVSFNLTGITTKKPTGLGADLHFAVSGHQGSTRDLSAEGDVKMVNNIFYIRATEVPPIPIIDPSLIMNKWFSVDPVAMYKEYGDPSKGDQLSDLLTMGATVSPEFYQKFYGLVLSEGLVSHIESKGSEIVGGVSTDIYALTIDMNKVPDFYPKYIDLYNTYMVKPGATPLPAKTFTVQEKADLAQVQVDNVTVSIGKRDYLPYHVTGTIHLNNVGATANQAEGATGTVSIDETITDYNKPVTVEVPADSMPLEQFLSSLFSGALMSGMTK